MLTKFSERLQSKGVAHPNKYRIQFSGQGPSKAGKWDDAIGLMCESIEFPGRNFMSSPDSLRYGPPREAIGGVTYAPITATFICSAEMFEKRWFEIWQEQSMDFNSWEPNYYKDYTGDLKIFQLDKDNAATYVISLFEVYPKTITSQSLGSATNDAYHTVSIELMYHHWEYSAETTPRQRHSPVIRIDASVMMSHATKSKAQGLFATALAALGNYQDEKAKNPPASGPPGRNYPLSQQEQANAKMAENAMAFIKGGFEKAAGAKGDPGVLFSSGDMNSMAGMAKAATGMQATMMSKMNGAFSSAGGMKISLGGQFNMRMSTPNLGRVRGMANPMSMVPKVNMASKLASMFSGGGGTAGAGGAGGGGYAAYMAKQEAAGPTNTLGGGFTGLGMIKN